MLLFSLEQTGSLGLAARETGDICSRLIARFRVRQLREAAVAAIEDDARRAIRTRRPAPSFSNSARGTALRVSRRCALWRKSPDAAPPAGHLFADPRRTINLSVGAVANEALDAWQLNVICPAVDGGLWHRCLDLFDFGDHLGGL